MFGGDEMDNSEYIFNSPKYIHIVIEYSGEFTGKTGDNNGIYITIINEEYAIISIKEELLFKNDTLAIYTDIKVVRDLLERYSIVNDNFYVVYILPPQLFTLQETSAIDDTQVNFLQSDLPLKLTGEGVIVGIIDTGIDYLNESFIDKNGKSRIVSIWDQTIYSNISESSVVPFGSVYRNDEINKAIEAYRNGKNPYDIVPSKDQVGHGTGMAGIIGSSGKNSDIKGIAQECEFVIVKLSESNYLKSKLDLKVSTFGLPSVLSAIEYLKTILITEKKPVVILLPLGSINGNHKGNNIFDSYIENVSSNVGLVIVTGAGNEGNEDGHASGVIKGRNNTDSIELLVEEKQQYMLVEIWVDLPNVMDINLVSPSGEETDFIPAGLNISVENKFIFEKCTARISYFLPEEYTGDQLITIVFNNITPGIWQIKLRLKNGTIAPYNAWMLQKGIVRKGTRFSPSDPYGTITIPGDSDSVVTVAAYNQNNNNLLTYSGVSFRDDYISRIDFAAGGVNTASVGLNNSIQILNGTSLSAAIGAGACVLLFQWGIVQGNYKYMYSQSIKTFLRRGCIKRGKEIYPTPGWGYGIINFMRIFENMM